MNDKSHFIWRLILFLLFDLAADWMSSLDYHLLSLTFLLGAVVAIFEAFSLINKIPAKDMSAKLFISMMLTAYLRFFTNPVSQSVDFFKFAGGLIILLILLFKSKDKKHNELNPPLER